MNAAGYIVAFDPFEPGDFDGVERGLTADEARRANTLLWKVVAHHLPGIRFSILSEHLVAIWRAAYNRPYVAMNELEHYGLANEILSKLEDIYQETWERLGAEVDA